MVSHAVQRVMDTNNNGAVSFRRLTEALDLLGISYSRNDEELYVYSAMKSDGVPMEFTLSIDAESQTLNLVAPVRIKKSEKTRFDVAIAVGISNSFFCDGCFDLNIETGDLYWRNCQFFESSAISKDMVKGVIFTAYNTVRSFEEKFSLLSEGTLGLDGFLRALNG